MSLKWPFFWYFLGIYGRPWVNWDKVDLLQIHRESNDFVKQGNEFKQGQSLYLKLEDLDLAGAPPPI